MDSGGFTASRDGNLIIPVRTFQMVIFAFPVLDFSFRKRYITAGEVR